MKNKFNVGDKVRVLKSGIIGQVTNYYFSVDGFYRYCVTIHYIGNDCGYSNTYWFRDYEIEKVEDEAVKDYIDTDIAITNYLQRYFTQEGRYLMNRPDLVAIKSVIFNPPATIVFWADNSKTVVKAENEDFDREKGLAMAIAKRALGNKGNYYEIFKKWLPKERSKEDLKDNTAKDNINKGCDNCMFGDRRITESPCRGCDIHTHSEWEPTAAFYDEEDYENVL